MFWLACNVDDFWNFEGPFNSLAEVLKAKQDCIQRYTYDVTPYKQYPNSKRFFRVNNVYRQTTYRVYQVSWNQQVRFM